jgi:hypothetical protein
MASTTALLEAVIRRDRLVLVAGILLVSALAWGWLVLGAGTDMSAIEMTRMAGMDGWMMQPAVWTPAYALLMISMWWVMMVAMMLPSAAPMLLLFARVNRKEKAAGSPLMPTGAFAPGYLIAWGGFSVLAVGLQWALEAARVMSPMPGGDRQRMDRRRHPRGRRLMATHAVEDHVPAPLPLAARLSDRQLARGPLGRIADGIGARRILSRVLLVLDGAAVLRRRNEPVLDRRPCGFRTAGEGHAARPNHRRCLERFP